MGKQGNPLKRNLEETRLKILRKAKEVFSEKGYGGARIDQIARAAGVSKAMIYYLHASKEELYKNVLESVLIDIAHATRNELSRKEFRPEDFQSLLRIGFDIFRMNTDVARILLREFADGAPFVRQIKIEHPDLFQVFGLAIDRIYGYIKEGKMREVPAERYFLALMALVLIVVVSYPSSDLFLEREDGTSYSINIEEWKDVIVDIFTRSIMP
jgi:AcrR family transcriptional regulator